MKLIDKIVLALVASAAIGAGGFIFYAVKRETAAQEQAISLGFLSAEDHRKALAHGLTDPAAWAPIRKREDAAAAAEKARRDAEAAKREAAARAAAYKADLQITACVAAEFAVRDSLKAPTTAQFPGCAYYEVRMSKDERTIFVTGYVDAQNSFGAMLRSKFIVKFGHNPGLSGVRDVFAPVVALN